MARCPAVLALILLVAGMASAQEEYFVGTPAQGARPVVPFGTQENNFPALQAATCIKALDVAYDVYSYTGNWSKVPNQPHLDRSHNIFCFHLIPIGVSSNESQIVVHSQFPIGWRAIEEVEYGGVALNRTSGTVDAFEEIIAAVRTVSDIDGSYFGATVNLGGPAGAADAYGSVLGRVIYGRSRQDLGDIFWCACLHTVYTGARTYSANSA